MVVADEDRQTIKTLEVAAVVALDHAMALLLDAELSEHEPDGWSSDLVNLLTDGMAAYRWFVNIGYRPPARFDYWMSRTVEDQVSQRPTHQYLDDAVSEAGSAIHRLEARWEQEWPTKSD
jgi:hypothetical protein